MQWRIRLHTRYACIWHENVVNIIQAIGNTIINIDGVFFFGVVTSPKHITKCNQYLLGIRLCVRLLHVYLPYYSIYRIFFVVFFSSSLAFYIFMYAYSQIFTLFRAHFLFILYIE